MGGRRLGEAFVLGAFLCIGLVAFGCLLSMSAVRLKAQDRTVEVKGLAEREVRADIAIWPIRFTEVDNELPALFERIKKSNELVVEFLTSHGFADDEISVSAPAIVDRLAVGYGGPDTPTYRYAGSSTTTVYTQNVDAVRVATANLLQLGESGVPLSGEEWDSPTEYIYTKLNNIKPAMIEEATRNAREVAEKFARDSQSKLGKIRRARQGQFSINNRDSNTPHIKKVRVVSTIEYNLSD